MAAKTMEFRVPTTVLVRKETTSALGDAQPSDKDPPKFRSAESALLEETIQKIMSSMFGDYSLITIKHDERISGCRRLTDECRQ
uniref:Uncharacterized protein n=1 Tax=Helianthus annuus TaxID=4232 RepID=A0A251U6A3_HELAN